MELSHENYDFAGWATRSNHLCTDGRTIMPDAFKHHDGEIVPLIWNHQHNDPFAMLGKALLHSIDGDIYAYCAFNDTESGKTARELVQHGDVCSLSICANQLKHNSNRGVMHGMIREVSLVVAGANPEARIESVRLAHSADGEEFDDEIHIYTDKTISLYHADEIVEEPAEETVEEIVEETVEEPAKEEPAVSDEIKNPEETLEHAEETGESIAKRFNNFTDEDKAVVYAMIGQIVKNITGEDEDEDEDDNSEGGNETMKQNAFDKEEQVQGAVLTHADQMNIIALAKSNGGCTLKHAMETYVNNNDTLKHGFVNEDGEDAIDTLFPEYKDVKPGAPELLERDLTWVNAVMRGVHKSPISRIRTRFADARSQELRAKGYQKKGNEKTISGNIKLVNRTTDPQTVYRKDSMHRDDIIDITDFDVVEYQYQVMRHNMEEELALAIMIGDGREEGDPDKISEEHIRSIWHDDDLYTIHADVDIAAAKTELQGTDTEVHFGENYIYAEAIITAALYAREKYKGKGSLEFYCTPHLLNVMLLARDLNGRRIYESKADLAAALNVKAIHTAEQFEGKTRTAKDGSTKKLLGLFVNLNDYHVGSTKGGEITRFSDFDIDFNQYKYLIETRLSGAMVNLYSAIALEEPVEA